MENNLSFWLVSIFSFECNVFYIVVSKNTCLVSFFFSFFLFLKKKTLYFPQYEDDEGDKVLLATDADLVGAIGHARSVGLKVMDRPCFNTFMYIYILSLCLWFTKMTLGWNDY